VNFSKSSENDYSSGGAESVKISFFLLETKKIFFLLKMQLENLKFQNPVGLWHSPAIPFRRPWLLMHLYKCVPRQIRKTRVRVLGRAYVECTTCKYF